MDYEKVTIQVDGDKSQVLSNGKPWEPHFVESTDIEYDGSTALPGRQEVFCVNVVTSEGTFTAQRMSDIAVSAGYSRKSAAQTSKRLLALPTVQSRLAFLRGEIDKKTGIQIEWIADRLQVIATAEKAGYANQLKALELLGRWKAMFTDRREIEIKPKRIIIRNENGEIEEEIRAAV